MGSIPYSAVRRKTAPRVVGGRALRKNNHALTRGLRDPLRSAPIVTRERPGRGYRHLVTQRDVATFLTLVPDWDTLSEGLHAIVLAEGRFDLDGYHDRGVVGLCAWDAELTRDVTPSHFEAHARVLDELGVPTEVLPGGDVRCHFSFETARAYQLVHVLLHELGHHHDRMTTRARQSCDRGEAYAEAFAVDRASIVWPRYQRAFSM